MNYDKICESIENLIGKERHKCFRETEVKMSCRPPLLIISNINQDEDRDEFYISFKKIVSEFLSESDGVLFGEDEILWLNKWASELEAEAKRMRRHAKKIKINK